MRSSNNVATVKAAIIVLAASVGLKVTFSAIAEPVAEVETASSKGETGISRASTRSGILVIGSMTKEAFGELNAAGKAKATATNAGGFCHKCKHGWATNNSKRGGPTTHVC